MGFCTLRAAQVVLQGGAGGRKGHRAIRHRAHRVLAKYWLEVSPEEQTRRLVARIDNGHKIWKLSPMDLKSYSRWYDYSPTHAPATKCSRRRHRVGAVVCGEVGSDDKRRARLNIISVVPDSERSAREGQTAQAPERARLPRAGLSLQVRPRKPLSDTAAAARQVAAAVQHPLDMSQCGGFRWA